MYSTPVRDSTKMADQMSDHRERSRKWLGKFNRYARPKAVRSTGRRYPTKPNGMNEAHAR
jgi:hypothetical protein